MSSNTFSNYLEMEVDTHVLILTASHSPSVANYFLSILEILQLRLCLILSKFVLRISLRRILHMWVGISLAGIWGFLFWRGSFVSLGFFVFKCVFELIAFHPVQWQLIIMVISRIPHKTLRNWDSCLLFLLMRVVRCKVRRRRLQKRTTTFLVCSFSLLAVCGLF